MKLSVSVLLTIAITTTSGAALALFPINDGGDVFNAMREYDSATTLAGVNGGHDKVVRACNGLRDNYTWWKKNMPGMKLRDIPSQKQLDNMFNYTVKCDAHDKAHPTRVAKFRR